MIHPLRRDVRLAALAVAALVAVASFTAERHRAGG